MQGHPRTSLFPPSEWADTWEYKRQRVKDKNSKASSRERVARLGREWCTWGCPALAVVSNPFQLRPHSDLILSNSMRRPSQTPPPTCASRVTPPGVPLLGWLDLSLLRSRFSLIFLEYTDYRFRRLITPPGVRPTAWTVVGESVVSFIDMLR